MVQFECPKVTRVTLNPLTKCLHNYNYVLYCDTIVKHRMKGQSRFVIVG